MSRRRLVLIIAAILLAGVALGSWKLFQRGSRPTQPAVVDASALHATWVEGTQAVLTQFDRDQDPAKARDALLALRVNAADKEVHQELVFAFEALATQAGAGEARVRAAQERFFTYTTQP